MIVGISGAICWFKGSIESPSVSWDGVVIYDSHCVFLSISILHSVDGIMVAPLDASCIIDAISASGHLPITVSLSKNDCKNFAP